MNFTPEQCNSKWKNLLRAYKKFIDNSKTTGAAALPLPPYYNEIHALVHANHAVNPANTRIYDSGAIEATNASPRRCSAKTTADRSGMVAMPEGIPGTSSHVPEGAAVATRPRANNANGTDEAAAGSNRERQLVNGVEEAAAGTSRQRQMVNGNQEAAGRIRQRQDLQVRLTPASHNAQMRALLSRNAEACEGLVHVIREKAQDQKNYRERKLQIQEALVRELRRYNDIMEGKNRSKRQRDSDGE